MWKWILLSFLVSASAHAQGHSSTAALAKDLDTLREQCVSLARTHGSSERTEEFKRRLDSQESLQRAQNEINLYSIGHGRSQTNRHMLDVMERRAQAEMLESENAAATNRTRDSEVSSCITDVVAKGKATYGVFKKAKRSAAEADSAASLMASWVVNVETVTLRLPEGTDESNEAWKMGKARADLSAL